ncbi:MAG: acetyl-CoA carboxylase biotin carboxyl carrier protein [Bacteroidetes bacterium]|nr:acetyl-CoA carboxylase biotin carboxyl carrier protein [Bacteroidota bacterium]
MDLDHLREILELVASCDVSEVEIEEESMRIVVRKHAPVQAFPQQLMYAAAPAPLAAPMGAPAAVHDSTPAPVAAAAPSGKPVRAPIVGTFYTASSPDSADFVKVGDKVKVGDVVCIIEAMKLMNEIESDVAGTVVKILVDNATPVEYDQPLFLVDPN